MKAITKIKLHLALPNYIPASDRHISKMKTMRLSENLPGLKVMKRFMSRMANNKFRDAALAAK